MTREQELILIEIGLNTLLMNHKPKKRKYAKRGTKWTKERHARFAKSMAKRWGKKRSKQNESI